MAKSVKAKAVTKAAAKGAKKAKSASANKPKVEVQSPAAVTPVEEQAALV